MSTKLHVLVPDGDSTWALSVIQCLSHVERYKLFVLSNKKRTATKYSKYTSYYKYYERTTEANWLEIIKNEIQANNISIVVPIAESELYFFIKHKETISQFSKIIPLPELTNFEIAKEKRLLSEFAQTNEIRHPRSFNITSESDKQAMLSTINFPILIKPKDQKGGDGIIKITTKADFEKQIPNISQPLFIQEYIEGYDIDCSVLCRNGKIITYTIQQGTLQGHSPFAPQLGFDFVDNDKVFELVREVMLKLDWSGVAHLDMRYDKKANDYKLIEINPRFWGSIEASRVAGINFPDLVIQLAHGQPVLNTGYEHTSYMRLKGVFSSIKRRPAFILKRSYLMNNTEVKTFLNDPLPTLYKFREWLGRQF
ncbi:ATP-grasp domain-containing protein [uncultured Psychroserpens sp.]|uniref:ATP-grasp domain-containing protein n=1 Tax=uncultured Psychroserpens sp. TaxID=255436 RepID=UPI002602E9B9|nr:ATP-grasp domain-containing protein [uncultured Psychroserpens sp.]